MSTAFPWFTPTTKPDPAPSAPTPQADNTPIYTELAATHFTPHRREEPIAWPTAEQASTADALARAHRIAAALSTRARAGTAHASGATPPPHDTTAGAEPPHIRP